MRVRIPTRRHERHQPHPPPADPPDIVVSASQQDDPWEPVGLWSEVEVGQAYEEHELTFTAEQTMDGRNRVPVIAAGLAEGEYWFKNLKVVEAE